MIVNDRGREIIMEFESCQLTAYLCPAGRWTIGVGHTGDVKKGDRISLHQAETILEFDLERFERAVSELMPQGNSNQFSSCVSLAFNIGIEAFKKSTLLRAFSQGAPLMAASQFGRWVHAGGKVLPGLVRRRAAERLLFLTVPS